MFYVLSHGVVLEGSAKVPRGKRLVFLSKYGQVRYNVSDYLFMTREGTKRLARGASMTIRGKGNQPHRVYKAVYEEGMRYPDMFLEEGAARGFLINDGIHSFEDFFGANELSDESRRHLPKGGITLSKFLKNENQPGTYFIGGCRKDSCISKAASASHKKLEQAARRVPPALSDSLTYTMSPQPSSSRSFGSSGSKGAALSDADHYAAAKHRIVYSDVDDVVPDERTEYMNNLGEDFRRAHGLENASERAAKHRNKLKKDLASTATSKRLTGRLAGSKRKREHEVRASGLRKTAPQARKPTRRSGTLGGRPGFRVADKKQKK